MAQSEESPLRIRVITALVVLGTYLAGVVSGVGLDRWVGPLSHHPGPPPMGLPLRELDLTADQEAAVQSVIERHRGELEAVMQETFPRVRAIHEQIEREIRPLLTAAQQRRWDLEKERRPPPPPPGAGMGPGGAPPNGMFPPPDPPPR